MEQAPKQKHQKKPHHPHHVVPKHETGYTDEAAEECHDLIDQAEEKAHLHEPGSMYSTTDKPEPVHRAKGGLEGSSSGGSSATGQAGEKMGQMKDKMGMNK